MKLLSWYPSFYSLALRLLLSGSVGVNWPYGCVVLWVDRGGAGFTKKSGVFFAYGVDGPEFFPAL